MGNSKQNRERDRSGNPSLKRLRPPVAYLGSAAPQASTTIDLGKEQQIVLELRPSHDPTRTFGFVNVVVSLKDLSASIWLWKRDNGSWSATKVIEIPSEPADPDLLPPILKGFKAVPPLVTDINLTLDDKWLYVSCWGTGELRRYDVSVPDRPKLASVLQIGGIVRRRSE